MVERIKESVSQIATKPVQIKEEQPIEVKQEAVKKLPEQSVPLKEEELQKFAEQVNEFLQPTMTHVEFKLHDDLKEYYVEVIDNESKEVIREIPSKKMMDMYAAMNEFLGLLFDQKV